MIKIEIEIKQDDNGLSIICMSPPSDCCKSEALAFNLITPCIRKVISEVTVLLTGEKGSSFTEVSPKSETAKKFFADREKKNDSSS